MFRNTMNLLRSSLDTIMRIPQEVSVPVRFRYFKDKPVLMRRWGFKDKVAWRGLLPRLDTLARLPKPLYQPKDRWCERRALFGQNDYIDILGDEPMKLNPVTLSYGVPAWLRGFTGNEFQIAVRKKKYFGMKLLMGNPFAYNQLRKIIGFQYKFLNRRKTQRRMPREYKQMFRNT